MRGSCCHPTSCCCCLDLGRGCKAIALFGIIIGSIYVCANVAVLSSASDGGTAMVGLHAGIVAGSILHIAFNAMLMHGIRRRRTSFILAWLIYTLIQNILGYFLALTEIGVASYMENERNVERHEDEVVMFGIGFTILFLTMIWTYFWLVVRSYHRMLRQSLSWAQGTADDQPMVVAEAKLDSTAFDVTWVHQPSQPAV